jgi:hypothetical protein
MRVTAIIATSCQQTLLVAYLEACLNILQHYA